MSVDNLLAQHNSGDPAICAVEILDKDPMTGVDVLHFCALVPRMSHPGHPPVSHSIIRRILSLQSPIFAASTIAMRGAMYNVVRIGSVMAGVCLLLLELWVKFAHPTAQTRTLSSLSPSLSSLDSDVPMPILPPSNASETRDGAETPFVNKSVSSSSKTLEKKVLRECKFDGPVGKNTVKYRQSKLEMWNKDGCKQWGLEGPWERRADRKIYYAFPLGGELEILHIVLEEIYPSVDYIIILEGKVTWRGDTKPLVFPKFNQSFPKYWDKVRYIAYNFEDPVMDDRLKRCMTENVAGTHGAGVVQCRWLRQWGARDHLVKAGTQDIGPNDVFLIADLDELVARQFLRAVKHCNVWPETEEKGHQTKCSRVGIHTFGHKYHFGCTIFKNSGHFHPDMCLGRCLKHYMGEELRREWGRPKSYFRKPANLQKSKYIGPAGWHMHGFLSNAQVLWKWFSRSGSDLKGGKWTQQDLEDIKARRRECNEGKGFFIFDALACEPLPHLVTEKQDYWKHIIRYTNDSQRPDEFNVEPWYRDFLTSHRAQSESGTPQW